ncbi:hypothetical protein ACFLSE_00730 [Bacteroidota bacterium]
MKNVYIIILIGLLITSCLPGSMIEGKIILENDSLNVSFNIPARTFKDEPHFEEMQYEISFINEEGEVKTLSPNELKAIEFSYNNSMYKMVSVKNTFEDSKLTHLLLKLEIDGPLKLYSYWNKGSSSTMYNPANGGVSGGRNTTEKTFMLQKENDKPFPVKTLSFKKRMINYFNDCPELCTKIESQEFRKRDIKAIVNYYNSSCKTNK